MWKATKVVNVTSVVPVITNSRIVGPATVILEEQIAPAALKENARVMIRVVLAYVKVWWKVKSAARVVPAPLAFRLPTTRVASLAFASDARISVSRLIEFGAE